MLASANAREQRQVGPVQLDISLFSITLTVISKWQKIPKGMVMQGCLISRGVYAEILDGAPRLVPRK